ncbi:hypothetical protein Pfo_025342 [Paulownia fortunei]|nr:hypothetical protein Pfo_025342 [Paulownia fortunei]
MGSAEGFGGSGGGVVREVPRQAESACSSGVPKNETQAVSASSPAFWSKIPDSELCRDGYKSSRLQDDDASKDHGLGNTNSPLTFGLDAKVALQKSGKRVKSNGKCGRRSGMLQVKVSKSKAGLHDVSGISTALAASPASCNISEKTKVAKQKNSYNCRCGEKRNSKVHKNRCDSFSLKSGLVGFNSTAGGNNFFGVYGLKSDVFDIKKHVSELSLDELLRGRYNYPSIAKEKSKKAANSNNSLLQSVRKTCSILQDQKVFQAQKYAEINSSGIHKVSTGLMTASSVACQTDCNNGDSCTAELPSSDKVKKSGDKIKTSNSVANSPLYLPKDILGRLALPPPKDLDSLLSDASKATSSSKSCVDPRLGKPFIQRIGLPPFPWSHSFSGANKLGADSVKLSTSRTMCHGRWFKVKNSTTLQKGSVDLVLGFESLAFDQSLVPKVNLTSEHPENGTAPVERVLSSSGACSTSRTPADEQSPTYAAAKTLCDMATYSSKENLYATVKWLKKPSQTAMRAWNLKASEKSSKLFDAPKSTMRSHNPVIVGDDGFPSKKLRLSTDVTTACIGHTDYVKRGTLHRSAPQSVASPPRKLFRETDAGKDSLGIKFVNKSYMMKPPRSADRPSGSQQKLRKVFPVKWSRPEG